MMRHKHRQIHKGFSLMEVLVAMVILSVSLLAAINTVSEVTVSAANLQDKTLAQWVAMNKIAEMRLAHGLPADGRKQGEDDMAGVSWRWNINLKKTPYANLSEAEVEVRKAGDDRDAPPVIVLKSLIGKL